MTDTLTYYVDNGSDVNIASGKNMTIQPTLPVGTYSILLDPMTGALVGLSRIEDFNLPEKIYGGRPEIAERIINTFEQRSSSTGVHLDGVKGSGKTLLTKQLARRAAELGYATIVVNQPLAGEGFNKFIQSIDTPCVIIFDEFEKVYSEEKDQNAILTLFDGVYNSKKLFVLTTNEGHRVSSYMHNRPGRMFYRMEFDCLDVDAIREYVEDRLENQDHAEELIRYCSIYTFFNFDMLAAVVEEMNRYNEPMSEAIKMMNIRPEIHNMDTFSLILTIDDGRNLLLEKSICFDPQSFRYFVDVCDVTGAMQEQILRRLEQDPSLPSISKFPGAMMTLDTEAQINRTLYNVFRNDLETIIAAVNNFKLTPENEGSIQHYSHVLREWIVPFRKEYEDQKERVYRTFRNANGTGDADYSPQGGYPSDFGLDISHLTNYDQKNETFVFDLPTAEGDAKIVFTMKRNERVSARLLA